MISFARSKAEHIRLGRKGEDIARKYLSEKKFDILAGNFKTEKGEVDIIARDGSVICFIEVKTRRFKTKGRPAEGLSEKQKSRIRRAAMRYLREIGRPKTVYRFDLMEVVLSRFDVCELRYWTDNFGKKRMDES